MCFLTDPQYSGAPAPGQSGNIVSGVSNPFHNSQSVWLPGAGGLNPLNSQSAVGQLTKDVGQLNPFNPDSTAGKVVNNIGADMAKDPTKWVAIAACIAAGPAGWKMIPYVNAVATLTSKNSTPEDWLKEGAKAYVISAGGEWVSNNVTGVGPQTDITTGETFAGTGASGAMNSAKAGAVAGNISRNIFSTAARKGSTDINSAQIVTGAITNEALNEAFKFMPGFDGLTKGEQSATVNAFKTAFNKDSNAAYQLFNQGFDATIKGLNDAAKAVGYKDLNQQNAVNNFVQDQGSTEDVEAFNRIEKDAQDKYENYVAFQDKQKAFDAAKTSYDAAQAEANLAATVLGGRKKLVGSSWQNRYDAAVTTMNAATQTMADNRVQPEILQQANDEYVNARTRSLDNVSTVNTYIEEGWDNLSQKTQAEDLGLATPRDFDTYLTDQKIAQISKDNGFDSVEQMREAGAVGISTRAAYDAYMAEEADRAAWAKAQADAQAAIDAEVAAQAQAQADAQAKAQADEQAAIDAEVAAQAQAQADAQAAIDAEVAKATQEAQEAEEQARRVAEFGKDLTGGGNQDLGEVDTNTDFYSEDSTGMGAYKYDEKSGTYTYTSDDGSTLTLDGDGNIVGHTESTDTPWMGITDQKTGNMNLPKLPTGITPNVNVNTMNQPDIGLPALSPLVAAGMFGALMQNQKSGYNPAPVQAPNVTMDWNPQPVQAPENGIAYGQQFLNPTYSTGAAGGGLMSLAAGGMTGKFTTLGSYSDGGRLLRGPGDGMSDNIPATIANRQPARLADGEFVVPADVVSHLGNGSTDAGAKVLYAMMDRVRKARTGKAKQGKKIQPQKFVPI